MARPIGNPRDDEATPASKSREEDFAARFKESSNVLWLIAVGIVGDPSLADDVVQEAALVGLKKLDRYQPGTSFTAWMGSVVRYVALNQARKERRRRPNAVDLSSMDDVASFHTSSPADRDSNPHPCDERDRVPTLFDDRIQRALEAVSDIARTCLLLRVVEGMEYSRIAEVLGIPEGTAMSHVHRTRKFLRERLTNVPAGAPKSGEGSP